MRKPLYWGVSIVPTIMSKRNQRPLMYQDYVLEFSVGFHVELVLFFVFVMVEGISEMGFRLITGITRLLFSLTFIEPSEMVLENVSDECFDILLYCGRILNKYIPYLYQCILG